MGGRFFSFLERSMSSSTCTKAVWIFLLSKGEDEVNSQGGNCLLVGDGWPIWLFIVIFIASLFLA